jgi:hypothetical protein
MQKLARIRHPLWNQESVEAIPYLVEIICMENEFAGSVFKAYA